MNDVVRVECLRKSYQGREVLRGIDLHLERGRTYFLVGPNGCGKTTTIETLIGLRRLESGHVEVLGAVPGDRALRTRIRVCLQNASLHSQVTVREHLSFVAALYGKESAIVNDVAQRFDISNLLDRRFGRLSGGQQKRVMVASTLFGSADLIILDEPTSGVDLESRLSLWSSLREAMVERDTTLLATTHDLNEAEEYADVVIIMRDGRIHAQGTVGALVEQSGLVGVISAPAEIAPEVLGSEPKAERHVLTQDRGSITYGYTDRLTIDADLQCLRDHQILAHERPARLTDAYLFTYRGV